MNKKIVQLLHILHFNQQSHMIFNYLNEIIKQNKRISTLQKWQKSIHYRNNFENSKITSLLNLCLLKCVVQFFAIFATFQCDFDHNLMRTRWIFDIIDYLNRIHFKFQYEILIVNFIYWMQMLLRCEIHEIAKQWRDVELRNLIRCSSYSEVVSENFF